MNDVFGRDFPAGKGTWKIAIDERVQGDSKNGGFSHVGVRWSIAYTAPDGTTARVQPNISPTAKNPLWHAAVESPANYFIESDLYKSEMTMPIVFDLDGDGVGELLMKSGNAWDHEGESSVVGFIWTTKRGMIVPYSPSGGLRIEAFDDIDGDGRPDLIVERAEHMDPCGANRKKAVGVRFVMHARPDGTFSPSDDVATGYAKRVCPRGVSGGVVQFKSGRLSLGETTRRVTCARLWGRSAVDVDTQLARACTKVVPDNESCEKTSYAQGECPAWLPRWAKTEFPLMIVVPTP